MRILFMGTGEIGVPSLEALLRSRHELCGVVTQPDRPVGRKQVLTPPPPKVLAQQAGLPVLQPERLRQGEAPGEIAALAPEVIVVFAYGQILPKAVLEAPSVACINVHASLLPRHRGASCIQAPLAAGEATTGVTIMHVAEGLDTGDLILSREVAIGAEETGGELHDRLGALAPEVLLEALDLLERGEAPRREQDHDLATYAPKLAREDGEIAWHRPAEELERLVRAYHPWPGTFTHFRDSRGRERRLKIFPRTAVVSGRGEPGVVLSVDGEGIVVACGRGALALHQVQPDGSRRLPAPEFVTGHELPAGAVFFSLAHSAR